MRYGSICSGIEAATVAWKPLGFEAAFFSEIDKQARAVLRHHYPETPLHGDFTTIKAEDYGAIDILIGGTPCQSFSVAGLRGGIADSRGNLTLEFLRLVERKKPRWVVWENVPGVLSSTSHDAPDPCEPPPPLDMELDGQEMDTFDEYDSEELHAFNCFLAGLSDLGYGYSFRTLDAQYFGVPQRRKRVFVIGYFGDWRPAATVLFESESLRGNLTPERKKGENAAPTIEASADRRRGCGINPAALTATEDIRAYDTRNGTAPHGSMNGDVISPTLRAKEAEPPFITQLIPDISPALKARDYKGASSDGDNDGMPLIPIAFSCKDYAQDADVTSPTLRAMGHDKSHANAGGQVAVAIPIQEIGKRTGASTTDTRCGIGIGEAGDAMFTLQAAAQHGVAVAIPIHDKATRYKGGGADRSDDGSSNGMGIGKPGDPAPTLDTASRHAAFVQVAATPMAVRRLTPKECERLQGFKDDYTLVPYGKKMMADGPRYKMIGNSMHTGTIRWLGERIKLIEAEL